MWQFLYYSITISSFSLSGNFVAIYVEAYVEEGMCFQLQGIKKLRLSFQEMDTY